MKKILFYVFLPCLFFSCGPTGEYLSREISIPDSISTIEVRSGIRLILDEEQPKGSAVIYTYESIHPKIQIEINNSSVKFFVNRYGFKNYGRIEIVVSKDQYDRFVAESGSSITSQEPIDKMNIEVSLASGSNFRAPINATLLNASLSSGSLLQIEGQCRDYILQASSGSLAQGYDFICQNADVSLSSGSNLKITVNESLNGDASAGSMISYKGNPSVVDIDKSGGSSVEKK